MSKLTGLGPTVRTLNSSDFDSVNVFDRLLKTNAAEEAKAENHAVVAI
jgi:hypothetical protein